MVSKNKVKTKKKKKKMVRGSEVGGEEGACAQAHPLPLPVPLSHAHRHHRQKYPHSPVSTKVFLWGVYCTIFFFTSISSSPPPPPTHTLIPTPIPPFFCSFTFSCKKKKHPKGFYIYYIFVCISYIFFLPLFFVFIPLLLSRLCRCYTNGGERVFNEVNEKKKKEFRPSFHWAIFFST